MLTGDFAERAKRSYKTPQAANLLKAVRDFLNLLDGEMRTPPSRERGRRVSQLATELEMAADTFDLYGEKAVGAK